MFKAENQINQNMSIRYVARANRPSKDGKKVHQSIWLRESYREDGKVKKRSTATLKNCSPEIILAIKVALKHKNDQRSSKLFSTAGWN
jgi:hypothetical protein